MKKTMKIFLLCPVPQEQKPIEEYIQLQQNWFITFFFHLPDNNNKQNFFFVFAGILISQSFFTFFFPFLAKLKFFFFFGNISFFLFSLFILFRWKELEKRFSFSRLIYEESSWYDTEIWEKPFSILRTDKLLSSQKIKPLQTKIERISFSLSLFAFSFSFFFHF
jgi:hypothetical protein